MTDYLVTYFSMGDTLAISSHNESTQSTLIFAGSHIITANLGSAIDECAVGCLLSASSTPQGGRIEKVGGNALNSIPDDLASPPFSAFAVTSAPSTHPDYIQPLPSGFVAVGQYECSAATPTQATVCRLGSEGKWEQSSQFNYQYGTDNFEHFPALVANANAETAMVDVVDLGVVIF
jgi:hypothetical protein